MNTAKPSPVAHVSAQQIEQTAVARVVIGGRRSDPRDPMYMTQAEEVQSITPFMRRNIERETPDPRQYTIMPGGAAVYRSEAARKINPQNPSDVHGLDRSDINVPDYRLSRHQSQQTSALDVATTEIQRATV